MTPRKARGMAANGRPKAGKRGEGGGRPKADPAKVAAALDLMTAESLTPEQAAERVGIGGNTVRRAMKAPPTPPLSKATTGQPAPGVTVLPQGGSVSNRPDLLVMVRRILAARDPSALAELDAGLIEAAKGEAELLEWLRRPIAVAPTEDVDPLDALAAALAAATAHANKLPPLHPRAATVIGMVSNIAARLEKVTTGRPRVATPDEVTERIAARRDDAVRKVLEYTGEARAKLAADRAALEAWAVQNLGPMIAAEVSRRVGEMLGEKEGGGDGG